MDKPTIDYLGGMGFRMYSYILQFHSTTNSNTSHMFMFLYWYWGSCKNDSFFYYKIMVSLTLKTLLIHNRSATSTPCTVMGVCVQNKVRNPNVTHT